MSLTKIPATTTACHYVLTSRVETPNWRDRRECGKPLPCPDHTEAPAPEAPAPYAAAVAAELHRIADAIATVRGDNLADPRVELRITTKLFGTDPDVCAVKVATVDAIALAVLDRPGVIVGTGPAHDWVYHKVEANSGPVHVEVYELIADVGTPSEVERLRAELAEANRQLAHAAGLAISVVATRETESKIWACPENCGYHIADGPTADGEPSTDELISAHMEEHADDGLHREAVESDASKCLGEAQRAGMARLHHSTTPEGA